MITTVYQPSLYIQQLKKWVRYSRLYRSRSAALEELKLWRNRLESSGWGWKITLQELYEWEVEE